MWRTADYQSQLVANLIVAGTLAPGTARTFREWLAGYVAKAGRRAYVASDRHRLEVNYYDYRRLMKRLNRRFRAVRGMKLEKSPSYSPGNTNVAPLANDAGRELG